MGHSAHATVNDIQLHFIIHLDLQQGFFQGFHGTSIVALENQVQGGLFLEHRIQVLQGHVLPGPRRQRITLTSIPLVSDLPGNPVILDHQQVIASTGHPIQALHLNWA